MNLKKHLGIVFLFALCLWSSTALAQQLTGDETELNAILSNIETFSQSVMNADTLAIGLAYTEDAKIFPSNLQIISGRDAIISYWKQPEGSRIKYHKIDPLEIKITGNEAYDYGYYQGITVNAQGKEIGWKGKYVIIWRKIEGRWLIYLDIWNRIRD